MQKLNTNTLMICKSVFTIHDIMHLRLLQRNISLPFQAVSFFPIDLQFLWMTLTGASIVVIRESRRTRDQKLNSGFLLKPFRFTLPLENKN